MEIKFQLKLINISINMILIKAWEGNYKSLGLFLCPVITPAKLT